MVAKQETQERLDDLASLPILASRQALDNEGYVELIAAAECQELALDKTWRSQLSSWELSRCEFPSCEVPSAGYFRLRDVLVIGEGLLQRRQKFVAAPSILPPYRKPTILARQSAHVELDPQRIKRIDETAILPVTPAYREWGHWWLEMAHRLFPLHQLEPTIIENSCIVVPEDLPTWAVECLSDLFEIQSNQFVTYEPASEAVLCRNAVVPTMLMNPGEIRFHPYMNQFVEHVVEHCTGAAPFDGMQGLLYLSRKNATSIRSGQKLAENTAEVESLAASLGFTLVSPESLHWKAQVALLSESKVVAGEHGSAMKSVMFARPGTITVAFNYLNDSQAAIAALRGQTYLCLECEGFDPSQPEKPYRIDIGRLRSTLEKSIQSATR